jgi:hypothetical protein
MTDPLNRLTREAIDLRHQARGWIFQAASRPGDPATRQQAAERVRDRYQALLERKREAFTLAAPDLAKEAKTALFNTARMAAPHARRDLLREGTQWEAARHTAEKVKTEEEALEGIRRNLTQARRDFMAGVRAGALALKAYQEGWADALEHYLESPSGQARGGRQALDRLVILERAAAGEGLPKVLGDDLPTAQEMLGDSWPRVVA